MELDTYFLITKEEYDKYYFGVSKIDIVQNLVNWAILQLYKSDKGLALSVDERKIKKLGMEREAINWDDLNCYEVELRGDGTIVAYVEGAAYGSVNLKSYLERRLREWGWDVLVVLEW